MEYWNVTSRFIPKPSLPEMCALLQAGREKATAGNHCQKVYEAIVMVPWERREKRHCEQLHSAGGSPLIVATGTANPTSTMPNSSYNAEVSEHTILRFYELNCRTGTNLWMC